MISKTNRLYTKRDPSKEGKLYIIFCEGEIRETTYFHFFNRLASQIIIQLVRIEDGKNSPLGLYNNACKTLLKSNDNPNPFYNLNEDDEVWFIIDTDEWGKQILELREKVSTHKNWFVGQSNPSFEVWLYYHFRVEKPSANIDNWKSHLNTIISGGFNSLKHPIHIESAIINSERNFKENNQQPDISSTELFKLGKQILPLVKQDIDKLLKK